MFQDMVPAVTADEVLRLPKDGFRYELVAGELVRRSPAGAQHGFVSAALAELLRRHVRQHRLGAVFGAETGFLLARNPDTVLAADVAFVSRARLLPTGIPRGFLPFAPDLVAEVRSPSDSRSAQQKANAWLAAGSALCWIVDPDSRRVHVHTSDGVCVLDADADLGGGDVLPGFRVAVRELFDSDC